MTLANLSTSSDAIVKKKESNANEWIFIQFLLINEVMHEECFDQDFVWFALYNDEC